MVLGLGVLAIAVATMWFVLTHSPRSEAEARARILRRKPAPQSLNVVVVTIDTLRADRLGCYGFGGVQTPNIDHMAAESVLFEQATATVPLTFPSHSSIFTGLVPPHHGVRDNGGFYLDESKTTLAEVLKGKGYATGAFVGAWVLESKWGLAQGFDTYSDKFDLSKFKTVSLGTVQKPGGEVMDNALAWLQTVEDGPFFGWIHLYDPHTPYDPPEPFRSRYPNQPYLGEIAYTDQVVGRLLDWLRGRRLLERTLLVLTADHGESLGQHGEATHAFFIYDATTRVPLIVRTPWGDRGRVKAQASGVDIMPTVLDLVGLPVPSDIDGHSLALSVLDPPASLARVAYSETYFPRYHFGWQHLRSLRNGQYKYIDAPNPELYDLVKDPEEKINIYKAFSARAEDLRLGLDKLAGSGAQAVPERKQMDPETLQRLAALGYVGSAHDVDPQAVLPDPKEKVRLFALMGAAKDDAQGERLEDAVKKMRRVIEEDPGIIDAHLSLGNYLTRLKRSEEAISAYREVLTRSPDNQTAMLNLAQVYRSQGRNQAAIEGYKAALKIDPKSPQSWYHLATIYLDLGRVAEAESTFREAIGHNPQMGAGYNSLGAIAFSRHQLGEAERLIRKGLELEPDVRTGRFNLARILEARGLRADAESLYRAEIGTYADHGRARFNLAQLLREKGDREAYLEELRACVEKAAEFGACHFFLAREELSAGRLDLAASLAERGIALDDSSELAPLGHYVLADVWSRRGQPARGQEEAAKARRIEFERKRHPAPAI